MRSANGRSEGSLAERAWRELREQIVSNRLPQGYRALEEEIAARLKMSRTPVHEALLRLQAEGLVRVEPRRGFIVSAIAPEELRQIYDVVCAIETQAVVLLADRHPDATEIAPLDEAVSAMERAVQEQDRASWAIADDRYHRTLLDLCGNPRLAAIGFTHRDQVRRARLVTLYRRILPLQSSRRHRATVDAILAGDVGCASALHREGWLRGARELTALLASLGDETL